MKTTTLAIAAAAMALILTGCWQKSLHPFYTEKDLSFDEALVGAWKEDPDQPEDGTTWTFLRGEGANVYHVKVADKEEKEEFDGRLFKLGEDRLLDLHSRRRSVGDIPAHTVFRIVFAGSSLKMEILQPDWMKDWIARHPDDIAHVWVANPEEPNNRDSGEVVLSADTGRLQKFLKDHRKDENFWGDEVELKRMKLL